MKRSYISKKSSLLSKSLLQFACCIALCFILMVPLFYLLTKYYYAEDMIDIIEAMEQGKGIPPLDLEQDIIAGMMLQFLLIFIAIALALFITLRLATKKLWHPFDDTLQKVEQFNLAQSTIPAFKETDILEFTRLNQSLERLMKKDKETYRIQKEFTENASHELQTPLAIIRSKLDLLMQESLTEKQSYLVSDLYGLTIRMEHLNRNLLLLAKIENAQYNAMEEVDIDGLLSEWLPLYETLRKETKIVLNDRRTERNKKIKANPTLLECLLKNLIVNAIRHSNTNCDINIILEDNLLTVCNVSADGRSLDSQTLFRRFHTGDAKQKGNGLGLSIVKAVCDFHHWDIEYRFNAGSHQFMVNFNPINNIF